MINTIENKFVIKSFGKAKKTIITGKLEKVKKLSKCDELEGQEISAIGMDSFKKMDGWEEQHVLP